MSPISPQTPPTFGVSPGLYILLKKLCSIMVPCIVFKNFARQGNTQNRQPVRRAIEGRETKHGPSIETPRREVDSPNKKTFSTKRNQSHHDRGTSQPRLNDDTKDIGLKLNWDQSSMNTNQLFLFNILAILCAKSLWDPYGCQL